MKAIGYHCKFKWAYKRKCNNRFSLIEGTNKYALIPFKEEGEGIVVGIRYVIMSEVIFHHGHTSFEGDYTPPWTKGKKEWVYLVTTDIRYEPFIVRQEDLI